MDVPDLENPTTDPTQSRSPSRLRDTRLFIARTAWWIVLVVTLAMYVTGIPAYAARLTTPPTSNGECETLKQLPVPVAAARGLNLEQADTMQRLGLSMSFRTTYFVTVELIVGLALLIMAVLIFWRKSDDWAAVLISMTFISYGSTEIEFSSALEIGSLSWFWIVNTLQALGEVLTLIIFYIFPDGKFIPRWTRPATLIYSGLVLIWLLKPELPLNAIYGCTFNQDPIAAALFAVAWHSTGFFALIYRYRKTSNQTHRQQMKWVVFGLSLAFLAGTLRYIVDAIVRFFGLLQSTTSQLTYELSLRPIQWIILMIVPICFVLAILRYRLWDIDQLISRSIVYSFLTVFIIGMYTFAVGILSMIFQPQNDWFISLIGTGLVATSLQPIRERIQRRVYRLMYGTRHEPHRLLSDLSQLLESNLGPDRIAQTIVDTITPAFKLPYAQITLGQDTSESIIAVAGKPTLHTESFPLMYKNEQIGKLVLGLPQDETFSVEDHEAIVNVTRHAAVSLQAVRLTMDLQHSQEQAVRLTMDLQHARKQLVTDRAEERCRIRDDLHDSFLSRTSKTRRDIEEAIDLLHSAPDQSEEFLYRAVEEIANASALARSLIYKIRPPVLDLGLSYALADLTEQSQQPHFHVYLDVPEQLPPLHPAVEIAVYRIAEAALSNVKEHAQAHTCYIQLSIGDMLTLDIIDDGQGIQPGVKPKPGIGLNTMRERAEELSGSCTIEPASKRGTAVRVRLPVLLKNKRRNSDTVTDEEVRDAL